MNKHFEKPLAVYPGEYLSILGKTMLAVVEVSFEKQPRKIFALSTNSHHLIYIIGFSAFFVKPL